jgi:cellulose synthase operon protein C
MRKSLPLTLGMLVIVLVSFVAACKRDPNVEKKEFFESGTRFFAQGKYQDAAIQFMNAIRIDPKFEEAHFQLARTDMKLGQVRNAYQELSRAVQLNPRDFKAQVDLGNLYLLAHQFQKAQAQAQLVLKQNPKDVDATVLMANTDAGLSSLDASLKEMQDAIQLDPTRSQTYINLGILQLDAEKPDDAEASFKKAVQLDPKSAANLMALGTFYVRQHRWSDAEQQFQNAVSVAPKDPRPRADLAEAFMFDGKQDQAEQVLKDAQQAMPRNPAAYRLLVQFYARTGQGAKTLAEYASLDKSHPHDMWVKRNYGQTLVLEQKYDEAAKIDNEILKADKNDSVGLTLEAELDEAHGHPGQAATILQGVLKSAPDYAAAHYFLGVSFSMTDQLDRAEGEWREAVRLQPTMISAQRKLAAVAVAKGDMDLLSQTATALQHFEPNAAEGYILQARLDLARKQPSAATADLQKAIQVDPKNPEGYTAMGQLAQSQKKLPEAQNYYGQALALNPNDSVALQGLVNMDLAAKKSAQALQLINTQIAKAPNNSAYYEMLAQVDLLGHNSGPAEAAATKAVQLDSHNVEAYLLLAQIQGDEGNQSGAAATCQEAVKANPKDIRPYFSLAELDDGMGQWQKAQGLYQQVLQMQPDYAPAQNNLAYLLIKHQQNLDVALSLAQSARRTMPTAAATADTLGCAYYQKGLYQLAVDTLKVAVQEGPRDPSIHYHLALAYIKSGDRAEARAEFQRTLSINPNFKDAAKVKQYLAGLSKG